jgi:hypothetical protein
MPELRQDLVVSVIENGIKQPIQLLLERRQYPAALVLTYSGIDTMAFLNMPARKTDVMRSDFIQWAENYIKLSAKEAITGRDLYAARCSVLHGGAHSRLSRGGDCKLLRHVTAESPVPRDSATMLGKEPDPQNTAVTVVIEDLAAAFFRGVDRFLNDASHDEEKASLVELRLDYLVHSSPYVSLPTRQG